MAAYPLLVAFDCNNTERFVIVLLDATAGTITNVSLAFTEDEAKDFLQSGGEDEHTIAERIQAARSMKGTI